MRGLFTGPTVLAGVSLSSRDDPAFARAIIRLSWVLGTLPIAVAKAGASAMVKKVDVSPERLAELRADFARNDTGDVRKAMQAYLRWLGRGDDRRDGCAIRTRRSGSFTPKRAMAG